MKILFFAKYRELLAVSELTMDKPDSVKTVADLKQYFISQYQHEDAWQQVFNDKKMICAVNQELAQAEKNIADSDEVAFFPPVTGG